MKICIWSTSFQADTLALAIAMDRDPDIELLVVAPGLDAYLDEPIARFAPLDCRLLERYGEGTEAAIRAFDADVFVADNHIPKFLAGRKFLYHWHGVPLKIRPRRDIQSFHRHCNRLVGKPTRPNERFLAQCYGDMDFRYRTKIWGLAEENCRIWGCAYSDLLLDPPYRREDLVDYYRLDVAGRKNILLSLTWNYGERAFNLLGDDEEIIGAIFRVADEQDANIIFSLHDRFRFAPELMQRIESWAERFPRSFIKYKNEHADNLADLVASDVMICNFSSFIFFHYFMNRPSIHIKPVDTNKRFVRLPTMRGGGIGSVFRLNRNVWLYPFEDNGGCMPLSKQALVTDLSRSLEDPGYCADRARAFIADKIFRPDGGTCARIIEDLKNWAG